MPAKNVCQRPSGIGLVPQMAKLLIYVQSNSKSPLITMGTQPSNSQVDTHIQLPKLGHTSCVDFCFLAAVG